MVENHNPNSGKGAIIFTGRGCLFVGGGRIFRGSQRGPAFISVSKGGTRIVFAHAMEGPEYLSACQGGDQKKNWRPAVKNDSSLKWRAERINLNNDAGQFLHLLFINSERSLISRGARVSLWLWNLKVKVIENVQLPA